MSTIQIKGSIHFDFEVTDFEFAAKVQQLLKQHPACIIHDQVPKDQSDNTPRDRRHDGFLTAEQKREALKVIREKHATTFRTSDVIQYLVATFKIDRQKARHLAEQIITMGKDDLKLERTGLGMYHFLSQGSTQPPGPTIESQSATHTTNTEKSSVPIALPAST
jgi:hypothetical protein